MNYVILVGRLAEKPELKEQTTNTVKIILKVSRNFRNAYGEFVYDYIPIEIKGTVGQGVLNYCKKGDIIGVKGSIIIDENLKVSVQRINYISANKENENVNI